MKLFFFERILYETKLASSTLVIALFNYGNPNLVIGDGNEEDQLTLVEQALLEYEAYL